MWLSLIYDIPSDVGVWLNQELIGWMEESEITPFVWKNQETWVQSKDPCWWSSLGPLLVLLIDVSVEISFFFFNCGKNISHEIYPLNKFAGVQYSIFSYRNTVVHQISSTYSSCITEPLYPFINNSQYHPLPSPWQPAFYTLLLCSVLFVCFWWGRGRGSSPLIYYFLQFFSFLIFSVRRSNAFLWGQV